MKDVLYVPRLKENILSISALDTKGIRVSFFDGQVLVWPRGKTIDDATVIGEEYGGLYNIKGQPEQALVHDSIEPSELWHRALPMEIKIVSRLPEIQEKHEGICKGCAQGKNSKKTFPN